jgi:hypothetical protein
MENAVCERWFSVCRGYPICWGLVNSDVQKIYLVVRFWFCCKLHVWVEHTEVILYVFNVSVVGIINYQNVIDIAKICSDLVFAKELHEVGVF